MIRRSGTALFAASLLLGCSAPQASDKTPDGAPKTEQQRIINISHADLAVCYPKQPDVPAAVNNEVLIGLLVAARPQVMECLVDPKNRGGEKDTRVLVKTAISAGKVENVVSGENLSPDGQKCIQGALDKWLAGVPSLASKASPADKPVTAEAQFQHISGVSPTVKLGTNEASDIAGTVRLAESTWCDCYAEWKDAPPRTLKAKIRIVKHAAADEGPKVVSPADVVFEPTKDPAADNVAACLQKKVGALRFSVTPEELTVPYTFLFVNASLGAPLGPEAVPEIQFVQFEGIRGQRAAAAAIAVGGRTTAASTYDGLVQKYKAKPDSVSVDDLKAKCADLLKADDGWVAAIERQLEADEKTLAFVTALKAKDPQWERAEGVARSTVDGTKKDLETAKKIKTDDTGICPKERK